MRTEIALCLAGEEGAEEAEEGRHMKLKIVALQRRLIAVRTAVAKALVSQSI